MSKRVTAVLAVSITLFCSVTNADSTWPNEERAAFVAGCATGVIVPAKRDYAAAAKRAGNANPKPFPEDKLRASIEPMCACLADRMAQSGLGFLDVMKNQESIQPMIKEAMAGGRCKPGGLLGQMISKKRGSP